MLMNGTPSIKGGKLVAVLEKNGTLHVYWTEPNLSITWPNPNMPSKNLLALNVPLPALVQPNFYRAPPYPIKAVITAGGVGFAIGVIGMVIYSLVK